MRTFDVNQCSLRGSTFCLCLLRLGLAVTGAPAEHFGTRIHGVHTLSSIRVLKFSSGALFIYYSFFLSFFLLFY